MSEEMPEGMLQDCKTAARLVAKRRETSALSRLWALSEPKFGSPPANRDMDPPSDNVTEKGYTFSCRLSTEERNCSLSGVSHRRCASPSSRACWDDARTMQISNPKTIFSEQDVALVSREKNADGVNNSLLCDAILKLGLDELLGFCRCDEHPDHADLDLLVASKAIIRSGTAGR